MFGIIETVGVVGATQCRVPTGPNKARHESEDDAVASGGSELAVAAR